MSKVSSSPLLILGSYAFAEEVADLVDECPEFKLAGFIENYDRTRCELTLLDLPVLWIEETDSYTIDHKVVCSIGSPKRANFINQVKELGFSFATVVHPTARISPHSSIGEGSIASVGVIVASQTQIGEHVILNRSVLIGHHTKIGNYVTISPGANIAGRVTIGDKAYIGMGSIVLNDISIGSNSIVGAGAVVTRDVPDNVQVLGIPARITKELTNN